MLVPSLGEISYLDFFWLRLYSWPHIHHTDRRLGVLWEHAELVSKDAGIRLVVVVLGRRFKSRVSAAAALLRKFPSDCVE